MSVLTPVVFCSSLPVPCSVAQAMEMLGSRGFHRALVPNICTNLHGEGSMPMPALLQTQASHCRHRQLATGPLLPAGNQAIIASWQLGIMVILNFRMRSHAHVVNELGRHACVNSYPLTVYEQCC